MKTLKKLLMTVVVLLCSTAVNAYDFEVDGIYYNILSLEDLTVEVTSGGNKYSGEVIIPSTITYKTKVLTVTEIGLEAFKNCTNLISITLPAGVTSIGSDAFMYCNNLASINIPEGVTSIESGAFASCKSLTSIALPESVTSIGSAAFEYCNKLASINIPEGVTRIASSTFKGCGLDSITIPKGVASIGYSAFYGCGRLKELRLEDGESPLYIDDNGTFYGCPLNNIYLGRSFSYENYGYDASPFYKKEITSLTIGYCITNIETNAFRGCSGKFINIYLMCETPPSVGSGNFNDADYINTTVYVPQGTLAVYQEAEEWKNFWDIQEHEVPVAPNLAIKKCATPSISYEKGKLNITSETEGAEFVTEITNSDITKHYARTIELVVTYNVNTYAKLSGYANSDMAYATLCWIESDDASSGLTQIKSTPVLIKSHEGNISISGVRADTEITVYDINGYKVSAAVANGDEVVINTSLSKNDIAIIHIGDKAMKIVMR